MRLRCTCLATSRNASAAPLRSNLLIATNSAKSSMSGGAAVKLQSISDLPFESVETLIFDGLLQLQSKKLAA